MHLICCIHKYLHRQDEFDHRAGAEMMLHGILKTWVAAGHQATVVCLSDERPECWIDNVRVVGRRRRRVFKEADVLLTHLDRSIEAMKIARRLDAPLVHLVHNDESISFFDTDRKSDLYIFNSHWVARACGFRNKHIPWIVCHPPVWREQFETPTELTDRRYVTLTNLNERKGGAVFAFLAREMPDIQFLGIRGVYYDQVGSRFAQGLPNVKLLPPQRDMARVYAQSRVAILPSEYESWGMVAAEAASAGCAVVCTDTPGLKESMGNAAWFVPLEKRNLLDYWVAPIRALMTDDALWQHYSNRAVNRSLQFNPNHELDYAIRQIEWTRKRR